MTVPTYRPDIRAGPMGEADIAEEVARIYGYARIARTTPSWPQPGRLTTYQRDRRRLKDVLCGLGCSEAWTATFVSVSDQISTGFDPPYIEVTNPLVESERYLRSSMAAGLIRADPLQHRASPGRACGCSRWGRCSTAGILPTSRRADRRWTPPSV